jgi:acyl carrier protein
MNPQDRISYILETAAQKMAEIDFQDEPLSCTPETVLLGDGARLDSMGFVNFIVAVEDSIERELRMTVNLSEEIANRPKEKDTHLTVGHLCAILSDLIRQRHGG